MFLIGWKIKVLIALILIQKMLCINVVSFSDTVLRVLRYIL